MIKYLMALVISAMFFIGMIAPSISINFWHKLLYDKVDTKKQKKKDFKISLVIWSIFTIALFIYVVFFVD